MCIRDRAGLESYLHYFYEQTESFYDYFPKDDTIFFIDEPNMSFEHGACIELEFEESMKSRLTQGYILPGQMKVISSAASVYARLALRNVVMLSAMDTRPKHMSYETACSFSVQSVQSYNGKFAIMVKDLERYKNNKYRIDVYKRQILCSQHVWQRDGRLLKTLQKNRMLSMLPTSLTVWELISKVPEQM